MTERPLKVLHALGAFDPGGVETWLLGVLKSCDRGRIEFDFCTFGQGVGANAREVERLGGKILPCPVSGNFLSFRRRFRRVLREGHYDAVHSHVHCFSGALLRWAQAERVPMRIAHSHTSRDDRPDTLSRRYYRRAMKSWIRRYATHGLAASRLAAADLFGERWEEDARFRVLHYGIDFGKFQEPVSREQVRSEIGLPLDAPVVGHVGRFAPAKNHGFLLEIAGEILKTRPDVHFLFVGDGPLRPEIEARSRAMGISGNVHFPGSRADVPRLMRGAMDVFVFPSLWEGLGVALIEAQAAGLPCSICNTVPEEVVFSPESVGFLPLAAGANRWATQVIGSFNAQRPRSNSVLDIVTQNGFSIEESVSKLKSVYLSRQSCAPIILEQHV
ncbi:MAG: glycosyltransferase [Candidatus Acidiferrales bacterium]